MTNLEELIALTKENNLLLKEILKRITKGENEDFITNVIANLVSERLLNRQPIN